MAKEPEIRQLSINYEEVPQLLLTSDELYDGMNASSLRKWVENSQFEKKPAGMQTRALGDYFSMWANTAPDGGLLVIGISKDRVFEGCLLIGTNKVNELEKIGEVFCPDALYRSKYVSIRRDKDGASDFVLVFQVYYHKTRVIKTVEGKVFVRRGDSKMELRTPDEIKQLQADKGEIQVETEPCGLSYPEDFETSILADFAVSVRTRKAWNANHSTEEILELMHLGDRTSQNGFSPNIACALLFARQQKVRKVIAGCRVRFLRFEGEEEGTGDKWNAVKDEPIDGTIPQIIQAATSIVKSQLRTFSRLGTGGKFFTSPEYPEFAWYEAIVNACVHRSYGNGMKNTPIFVRMFDDRLVVESPGPFPPFVNAQNIYQMHVPRNPHLMEAMYYLDYVKCAHEGTRRIRAEMHDMELPAPEFTQEEIGHALVRVTLRNAIKQRRIWVDSDVAELIGTQIAHSLTDNEKRSINFCAEYGKISVSDAQRLTGLSWPAAKKMLDRLARREILIHERRKDVDHDPQARYKLNQIGGAKR